MYLCHGVEQRTGDTLLVRESDACNEKRAGRENEVGAHNR